MAWNLQRHSIAPGLSVRNAIPIRPLFHLVVATAMLALFTGHARAGVIGDVWDFLTGQNAPVLPSDADCDSYADEAEAAAVANENGSCGYPGPRFSKNNRVGHRMWCLSHTKDEVDKEMSARNDDIARCSSCNEYSIKANGQARENAIFHCGGGGPRWDSGGHHKQWCMSLRDPKGGSDAETGAREQALNQCKGNYTPAQLGKCTEYADQAVKQAKFNAANKCGGTGDRWSQNRDDHFAFCTFGWRNDIGGTDVVTAMKQERDAREAENLRCTIATKVLDNVVKSGSNTDPFRPYDPNEPVKASPGSAPFRPFDRNEPVVASPGKPTTTPPIATPPPGATPPIVRLPPPAVPAVPRQPSGLPPVVAGPTGGSGAVVLPPRPVPSLPLPGGASGRDGMLDWWKQKLPPVVFNPKLPSGTPPANNDGAAGRVPPTKPVPPAPTVPTRPSGEPPANGSGRNGDGAIVWKPKPIPSDLITSKAPSGSPPIKSDPAIVSRFKPVRPDLITSKPPADAPRLGIKAAPPLASNYKPVASSLITSKGSSGPAPVRSDAMVRNSPIRPAMMQGGVNRLSVGQDPLRLR